MDISKVKENYDKALQCFYPIDKKNDWHREDLKGWHYLLEAYYGILESEITDHLLYGRILKVLGHELIYKADEYKIFNKYLKEAKKQFDIAKEDNDDENIENDYKYLMKDYTYFEHYLKNTNNDIDETEQYKLMKNNELLKDFYFGDGVIKNLCIDRNDESIVVDFQNYHQIATIKFSKVYEIEGGFDIYASYIDHMYLYKTLETNHLSFDVGFLKILCDEIEVLKVIDDKKEWL